jgi:hypothetical protein
MNQPIESTLGSFVDHLTEGFTPELARHFADLPQPNAEFQARLDELAEKANQGTLTDEEARTYEKYVDYIDFVTLMRLKARSRTVSTSD